MFFLTYIIRGDSMKALLEILNSNQMTLSRRNIEAILFEELAKDPEEMDVELIEICVKALDGAYSQPDSEESKKKVVKLPTKKNVLRKVFLTAAVLMMSIGIAFPVAAKYVHNETLNNIVQYISGHFSLDLTRGNKNALNHSDNENALIKKLEEIGYDDIILPTTFLEQEYTDKDIQILTNDDLFLDTQISFKLNNNIHGYCIITKYKDEASAVILGQQEKSSQYDSANQLTINGMDIIIFSSSSDDYISVEYVDNLIEYSFVFENCDINTVTKIFKTLQ